MTPDNGQELVLSIFSIPPMPISSVFDPFEWTASSSNNLNFKRNLIGSGENQNLGAIQWRLGCWLHVPLPTNTTNFLLVFAFTPGRIFGWGGITWLILSLLATLPFPYPFLKGKSIDRRAAAARRRRFLRQRPTDSSLTMNIRGYAKKLRTETKKSTPRKADATLCAKLIQKDDNRNPKS